MRDADVGGGVSVPCSLRGDDGVGTEQFYVVADDAVQDGAPGVGLGAFERLPAHLTTERMVEGQALGRLQEPARVEGRSEQAGLSVALAQTVGRPEAIASSVTLPKVSVSLGNRKTSDEA